MSLNTKEKIMRLRRRLYPTGRAFHMEPGGNFDKLNEVQAEQEGIIFDDALSILHTILPDNPNFTAEDATRWEQRLGLIVDPPGVTLADRSAAILRKMSHPGGILARQSADYIQQSLQTAGFDLYVYDNVNSLTIIQVLALNPAIVNWGQNNFGQFNFSSVQAYYSQYFNEIQFGNGSFGQFNWGQQLFFNQKVINFIEPQYDIYYNTSNWRSVFYVGGPTLGEIADIPAARRLELRQLILRLKPVQTAGYLLINYT